MTSRPHKTVSVPSIRLQAFAILSPRPTFWSPRKNIWLLHPPKTFCFKKSQHDTLTICIKKSILIEIIGLIFVFLNNFTNSLSCEELLRFCIKIDNFFSILQGFHHIKQYQQQIKNRAVFVKSLNLCFYCRL